MMTSRILAFIFVLLLQPALRPMPATLQVLFRSDSLNGGVCYRIPALITAADGTLIAAADQRVGSCADLRTHNNINIVIRRSTDGGDRWSAPIAVLDYPEGLSASDPSLILDRSTGTLFLFFNFMDHHKEKGGYRLCYITSNDHGLTWSESTDITEQISPAAWKHDFMFISSGRGIQTQDGTLLHTLVNLERGLHLFASFDHGKHWQLLPAVLIPGDESKVVELQDGSWLVNSRVNGLGHRYVHRSFDKGVSWQSQPDTTLHDPGCNASQLIYPMEDGSTALLFANAADRHERRNMTLHISRDEGKSWPGKLSIWKGAAAYVDMTLLQDGGVGLLFEKDEYREIVFIRLDKVI